MKAIVIELNDKVVFCEALKDLKLFQFNDLHKEAIKNIEHKDKAIIEITNKVKRLEFYCEELEEKINYLGKQIAIDRGEIDADSEEEYEIVVQRKEEPIIEDVPETPQVSEEEDAYFEEKEESEVSE